ncbi:MAG: domain containing protein [Nocardioides sp.]|nr:domain containing protein [Nocardioides sp.]
MSDSGTPPPDPYGQQPPPPPNPYGQPADPAQPPAQQPAQPNPYGGQQPGYGQAPPAYGQPAYGGPAADYAHWGKRVGATLVDGLVSLVAGIPAFIGLMILSANTTTTTAPDGTVASSSDVGAGVIVLIVVGYLLLIVVGIWNIVIRQGRTGYSIGKGVLGIKLINEGTGQPIGAGMSFLRQIVHLVDSIPCYLGYLWPLWDSKRQTFADKILGTIVINQPKP